MSPIAPDRAAARRSPRGLGLGSSALLLSIALHAAALAGLLWLRAAPSPPMTAVIAVTVVQADPGSSAVPSVVQAASSGRPAEQSPAAVSEPPEAVPVPMQIAEEGLESRPFSRAAAAPVPAPSWRPPEPRRRPPAPASSPARVTFEATLTELKGEVSPALPRPAVLERHRSGALGLRQTAAREAFGEAGGGAASVTPARLAASGLSNPPPRYPRLARRRGQEGRVLLRVAVRSDGRPRSIAVLRSSGHRLLDEAALEAVRRWQFVPAERDGRPIEGQVDVPVAFRLTE